MISLAIAVVALGLFQSRSLSQLATQASASETQVSAQKDKEIDLVILKNRAQIIGNILKAGSKFPLIYTKINSLLPQSTIVSGFDLNRSGVLVLSLIIPDKNGLNQLFDNLTAGEKVTGVQNIDVDTLGRGKDGIYRTTLKLTIKQ